MKKLFTLSVGLVVLLLMAASASAASDSKTTETVKTGVAYWSIPNDYGSMCVDLEVDMYSDDTAEVYFYAYGYDASGVYRYYQHYGDMASIGDVFTVDKKLASASLSEFSFEAGDLIAGGSKTVTLSVDWAGVGDLTKTIYMIKGGTFLTYRGTSREATATGSVVVGDVDLIGEEPSTIAYLGQYTMTEMIKK